MRPQITRSRTWAVAAVGGAAALLTAACGSSSPASTANTASAPGITATTVTIGSTQPLTGPAAPGYSEIAPAANAYFKYVNAHGGVNGRTINYTFLDDQYNPTSTSTQTHKLILQDNVFAIFQALGTPTHLAVVNYINQSKVPDLFVASGCNCWNNVQQYPETFGWQPNYTIEGKILGQYIAQNFSGKKIGYFLQGPNDEFGTDGFNGVQELVAGQGPQRRRDAWVLHADCRRCNGRWCHDRRTPGSGRASDRELLGAAVHGDRRGKRRRDSTTTRSSS